MSSIQIIPALLAHDERTFLHDLLAIQDHVPLVHIDITDGQFVPEKTWANPQIIEKHLRVPCELHLMVENPSETFMSWRDVHLVERVLLHAEITALQQQLETLSEMKKNLSLVLNPEAPITILEPHLDKISGVMCMGIHPGAQGRTFIPKTVEKIRALKEQPFPYPITIDGGVNQETLPALVAAGVDRVCVGSALFKNARPPFENLQKLQSVIDGLT